MPLPNKPVTLPVIPPFLLLSGESTPDDLGVLYDKYAPCLYGLLLRSGIAAEAAEEQLQKCFVLLWQNRSAADSGQNVFTWMLNILRCAGIPLQFPGNPSGSISVQPVLPTHKIITHSNPPEL